MFHRRCNELRLTLCVEPAAPLLIKAGEDPLDYLDGNADAGDSRFSFGKLVRQEQDRIIQRKEAEKSRREQLKQERSDGRGQRDKLDLDMRFVRTRRNGREDPYLPGSSLKGVLRNRCEQLAATFDDPDNVCNIFDQEGKDNGRRSCTKVVEEATNFSERYRSACSICKLFGCGGLAGRLAVSDAYLDAPLPENGWATRSGVGINRQRGAAESGALFFYEVLQQGAFHLTLTLENFELWQLGLTAYALDDLLHGRLPVGYGTRRGLGLLRGTVERATLSYFGTESFPAQDGCWLHGVNHLAPLLRDHYGFIEESNSVPLPGATLTSAGLRQMWTLPKSAVEQLWQGGAAAWLGAWGLAETETTK